LLSPSPCGKLPARLDASIAAPGPHDFAVRLRPVVYARLCLSMILVGKPESTFPESCCRAPEQKRPSQPSPRIVTIAKRPSCGPGCATRATDLPDVTSGIFLREGLDIDSENQNLICPPAAPGGGRRVDLSHLVGWLPLRRRRKASAKLLVPEGPPTVRRRCPAFASAAAVRSRSGCKDRCQRLPIGCGCRSMRSIPHLGDEHSYPDG
jgi:hypothetical protein